MISVLPRSVESDPSQKLLHRIFVCLYLLRSYDQTVCTCLFRFHSAAALVDIWNAAYKPPEHHWYAINYYTFITLLIDKKILNLSHLKYIFYEILHIGYCSSKKSWQLTILSGSRLLGVILDGNSLSSALRRSTMAINRFIHNINKDKKRKKQHHSENVFIINIIIQICLNAIRLRWKNYIEKRLLSRHFGFSIVWHYQIKRYRQSTILILGKLQKKLFS